MKTVLLGACFNFVKYLFNSSGLKDSIKNVASHGSEAQCSTHLARNWDPAGKSSALSSVIFTVSCCAESLISTSFDSESLEGISDSMFQYLVHLTLLRNLSMTC